MGEDNYTEGVFKKHMPQRGMSYCSRSQTEERLPGFRPGWEPVCEQGNSAGWGGTGAANYHCYRPPIPTPHPLRLPVSHLALSLNPFSQQSRSFARRVLKK